MSAGASALIPSTVSRSLLHCSTWCRVRLCEFDTMSAVDVLPVVRIFRAVCPATVSERQY
jgi:hypothetical protein